MIKTVGMYTAVCDNCGKGWTNEHYGWTAIDDESALIEDMQEQGWHTDVKDKDYCPNCHYFNDDDELVVRAAAPQKG